MALFRKTEAMPRPGHYRQEQPQKHKARKGILEM